MVAASLSTVSGTAADGMLSESSSVSTKFGDIATVRNKGVSDNIKGVAYAVVLVEIIAMPESRYCRRRL